MMGKLADEIRDRLHRVCIIRGTAFLSKSTGVEINAVTNAVHGIECEDDVAKKLTAWANEFVEVRPL